MSDQFMETVLIVAGICLFLMMIPIMFRIIVGPTAIDRIVAVNIIGTKTAVLLIIIGALFDNVSMFVDFAIAYAALNFLGSLAASRYFNRTRPAYGKGSSVETKGS
ncbi:MAG: monovalent cation/H+ antiporter complex subunit F [Verrucomicrobiota bacterium]|jgi:multicomponent Na+:H+ antiporter subunit F|nr:monovalent cation/H+ antiporter complex subunit F [Verrucomicrobiota bacterium]MEE2968038.1 monovalent cation/H+ antiporter complex subunit F [Verrucomicrobiota bacterium]